MPTNHVAIVLDESGSMLSLKNYVIKSFNEWTDTIQKESSNKNQKSFVSLYKVSTQAQSVFTNQNSNQLLKLDNYTYSPSGMTALYDGVVMSINDITQNMKQSRIKKDVSALVIVITDGFENASSHENNTLVKTLLVKKQKELNWTFVFLVPSEKSKEELIRYGVPNDNIRVWETTTNGLVTASSCTQSGLSNYYSARSTGQTQVMDFFVQADLSKLKTKDVKSLRDISSRCSVYTVSKECVIKDFVESKTKDVYNKGSTYYQLTKPEKIQSYKDLLIMEKGKPQIYQGAEARTLIGIPVDQDGKIEPFNLSKWDVFIQSTSVNRKLVRGTKIIVVC